MSQQLKTDRLGVQRLDHAACIEFLTSLANGLVTANRIQGKLANDLRISLSAAQVDSNMTEEAFLTLLHKQNSDFFSMILALYGPVGLSQNLWRHRMTTILTDTRLVLSLAGERLVKKGELIFNRPFHLFIGNKCETRQLFSSVLSDLAKTIADAVQATDAAIGRLDSLIPCGMFAGTSEDTQADEHVAKALGFSSVSKPALPFIHEQRCMRILSSHFTCIGEAAIEFMEQLAMNQPENENAKIVVAGESLVSLAKGMMDVKLGRSSNIDALESKRLSCLTQIENASALSGEIIDSLCNEIKNKGSDQEEPLIVSNNLKRRISYNLIKAGLNASSSFEASEKLVSYCTNNNLRPEQIIESELKKIHPALELESLAHLKSFDLNKSLTLCDLGDKQRTHKDFEQMMKVFAKHIKNAAPLALGLVFLLLPSCGLKTNPTSSLIDLRPQIQFHNVAPKVATDHVKTK